jgi:hypothetical protein
LTQKPFIETMQTMKTDLQTAASLMGKKGGATKHPKKGFGGNRQAMQAAHDKLGQKPWSMQEIEYIKTMYQYAGTWEDMASNMLLVFGIKRSPEACKRQWYRVRKQTKGQI